MSSFCSLWPLSMYLTLTNLTRRYWNMSSCRYAAPLGMALHHICTTADSWCFLGDSITQSYVHTPSNVWPIEALIVGLSRMTPEYPSAVNWVLVRLHSGLDELQHPSTKSRDDDDVSDESYSHQVIGRPRIESAMFSGKTLRHIGPTSKSSLSDRESRFLALNLKTVGTTSLCLTVDCLTRIACSIWMYGTLRGRALCHVCVVLDN